MEEVNDGVFKGNKTTELVELLEEIPDNFLYDAVLTDDFSNPNGNFNAVVPPDATD